MRWRDRTLRKAETRYGGSACDARAEEASLVCKMANTDGEYPTEIKKDEFPTLHRAILEMMLDSGYGDDECAEPFLWMSAYNFDLPALESLLKPLSQDELEVVCGICEEEQLDAILVEHPEFKGDGGVDDFLTDAFNFADFKKD